MVWKWYTVLFLLLMVTAEAAEPPVTGSRPAQQFLDKGDYHLSRNELFEARSNYDQAIALDPSLDKAYLGRGIALGRMRELDAGLADLNVFLSRNPGSSYGHTKRGIHYVWMNDLDSAFRDLQRAIELDPANAEALDDIGVLYARQGEVEKAIASFLASIQHEPIYQKAYHNLAMMRFATEDYERALYRVDQALELQPSDINALRLKATILEALGRKDEAAAILEEVEFMPQDLDWRERLPVK